MWKTLKILVPAVVFATVLAVIFLYVKERSDLRAATRRATEAFRTGRYAEAAKTCESILQSREDYAPAIELYIRSMYALGRQGGNPYYFQNLLEQYTEGGGIKIQEYRARVEGPDAVFPPDLLTMVGYSNLELEELDSAEKVLSESVKTDLHNADAFLGLARVNLLRSGLDFSAPRSTFGSLRGVDRSRLQTARNLFRKALELRPGDHEVRFYLGLIAWNLGGSHTEKDLIFSEAENDAANTDMRLIAALAYLSQWKTEAAEALLNRVSSTPKNFQRALKDCCWGTLKFMRGDLEDARRDMLTARRNDEAMWFPNIRLDLANIETKLKRHDEAHRYLKELKDSSRKLAKNPTLLLLLMLNADKRNDPNSEYHKQAEELAVSSPGILLYLASRAREEDLYGKYEQILEKDPDNEWVHYNLGTLQLRSGSTSDAIEHLRKVTAIKPDFLDARVNLCIAYHQMGDNDLAIAEFESILQDYPDLPEALIGLGLIYLERGEPDKARAYFLRVPEVGSRGANAQLLLSRIERDRGKVDEAIEAAKRAKRLNPRNNLVDVALGNLYLLRRDPDAALKYFGAHLVNEESLVYPDALNGKAVALYLKGEFADAEGDFARLIDSDREWGNRAVFLLNRGCVNYQRALALDVTARKGLVRDAIEDFDAAASRAQNLTTAPINLGVVQEREGNWQEAEQYYRTALNRDPASIRARYNLANILARMGKLEEANAEYETLMASNPAFVSARVNHAVTQVEMGQLGAAEKELQDLLAEGVESPVIHNAMANLFLRRGGDADLALAEEHCEEARRIDPNNTMAWTLMGILYQMRTDFATAKEYFYAGGGTDAGNVAAQMGLGRCQIAMGELQEGLKRIREARNSALSIPGYERNRPEVEINLAFAYLATGYYDEAEETLGQISESMGPKMPADVVETLNRLRAIE